MITKNAHSKFIVTVLVLQHGLGDEANAWIEVGAANVTLDTLINQGKAAPMIMVNPPVC